jgi:hypothetical protein
MIFPSSVYFLSFFSKINLYLVNKKKLFGQFTEPRLDLAHLAQ